MTLCANADRAGLSHTGDIRAPFSYSQPIFLLSIRLQVSHLRRVVPVPEEMFRFLNAVAGTPFGFVLVLGSRKTE